MKRENNKNKIKEKQSSRKVKLGPAWLWELRLDFRRIFLPERAQHWHRLPREVVEASNNKQTLKSCSEDTGDQSKAALDVLGGVFQP